MSFNFHSATTWDKEVTLTWFLYNMPVETRYALMRDLPQAYNRLMGQTVVSVTSKRDGSDV
jgi:hypothetical protein